jgi:hypothetical protein
VLFALGFPPGPAALLLASHLIPNPRACSGDQVIKHVPMTQALLAYQARDPVAFTDNFLLPTMGEIEHLAAALRLNHVIKARHGHVASRGGALLVVLYRLRTTQSWRQLSAHELFRSTLDHRWSATKLKKSFRATMIHIHNVQGSRITWSTWCFSAASCARYAQALCGKLGINAHQNIFAIIDGTHLSQTRPTSQNSQNRQRKCYNGWLH